MGGPAPALNRTRSPSRQGRAIAAAELAIAWRFAVLGGLTAGLALSPLAPADTWTAGFAALAVLGLARPRAPAIATVAAPWLGCLALAAAAVGLGIGSARVAAIDAGAFRASAGATVSVRGHVLAVPKRADGEVRIQVGTPGGRLLVEAAEPVGDLAVGSGVRATGAMREPAEWERAYLTRLGLSAVLVARSLTRTGARRGGVTGILDRVRARAENALGRGAVPDAAALLRGFVLGQDDRIEAATVDEFKRSGLAHLLAVSGQNVVLLALLAAALLAVLGVPLRARLVWILVLIAVYVPVAGAGPSIQRAGVMGAAAIVAALASRPSSRWYALLLAAAATLLLNPRASGDVGWQLSFAAVIGLLVGFAPLRSLFGRHTGIRAAVADGAAVTLAATLATAPLMALHFETASLVAVPANLIALPAVAPAMWLGMLAAAAGQLAWLPVEPITFLAAVCAGYVAQVAAWFAAPEWALAEFRIAGFAGLLASYAAIAAGVLVVVRLRRRRRALRARRRPVRFAGAVTLAALAALAASQLGAGAPALANPGLRVRILDVGQGDAILLEPAGGDPVLIDAGTADAGVAERLAELGVERLAAAFATHPEADHAGGIPEVLARVPTERLGFARLRRGTIGAARATGADTSRVAAGDRVRIGRLHLDVLWPPAPRLSAAREAGGPMSGDPNALALVVLARWRGFEILLTADAEAETAPVASPEVEVLKVAHHGSEDAGLPALLERGAPELAVISVGAENTYGHPAPATLGALADAGVPVERTDLAGEIVVESDGDGWWVR